MGVQCESSVAACDSKQSVAVQKLWSGPGFMILVKLVPLDWQKVKVLLLELKFECYPAQRRSSFKKGSVVQSKVVAFAFKGREFLPVCSVKSTWEEFTPFYFPGHLPLREKKLRGQGT